METLRAAPPRRRARRAVECGHLLPGEPPGRRAARSRRRRACSSCRPRSLTTGCAGRRGRAPLLYDEDERVYLQALAPHAMMRQVDLSFIRRRRPPPPSAARPCSGGCGCRRRARSRPSTTTSRTPSCARCRAEKRLLLWSDDALPLLQPYADDHALARRLQLDLTDADECAHLAAAGGAPARGGPPPRGRTLLRRTVGAPHRGAADGRRATRRRASRSASAVTAGTCSRALNRCAVSRSLIQ